MFVLKIVAKVFQWILTILIGLLFILSCIMFISKLVSKDKLPMSLGFAFLNIETGSMSPTIEIDDVVIIHKTDKEDYQVGDIVAFWMNEEDSIPTVHRIIKIDGDKVYTKGDYVKNTEDPEHTFDDLIGKEVVTIPQLGKVVDFIRKPVGIVTILIIGFLIIEIPSIISRIIHRNDEEEPEPEN